MALEVGLISAWHLATSKGREQKHSNEESIAFAPRFLPDGNQLVSSFSNISFENINKFYSRCTQDCAAGHTLFGGFSINSRRLC